MSTSTTTSSVCGADDCSAAWMTYHFAKKPAPPAMGNPRRANINTAIANAVHGRTLHKPASSSSTTVAEPRRVSDATTAKQPNVANV